MSDHIVIKQPKSKGISLLLTILMGPIGLLYSTLHGAFMMLGIGLILFLLFLCIPRMNIVLSSGELLMLLVVVPTGYWFVCLIWSITAVHDYNKKLMIGNKPE